MEKVVLSIITCIVVALCYYFPKKKKTRPTMPVIFKLTPMTELKDGNQSIYNEYLESVFQNKDILNVAITGGKGFGKSSVIRSFENDRKSHFEGEYDSHNEGFLYITLGNDQKTDNVDLDKFGHRLLIQIYSRFHKKDLPLSFFRLVQESDCIENTLFTFGLTMFVITITLIIFKSYIGRTIISINNQNNALGILVDNRHLIILFLYVVVLILGALIIYRMAKIIQLNIKYRDIKLKEGFTGTELEINAKSGQYLDKYTADLIYCLEAVLDKIDGTVVFEDFDRYKSEIYEPVFFRLREINESVNRRIKMGDCNKALRFIYVINNDSLKNIEEYQKYFDYILTVSPHYNTKTAEKIIEESLDRLHENFCARHSIKGIDNVRSNEPFLDIITTVASAITDRRLLNTIMNDYSLMADEYYNSKVSKKGNDFIATSKKENMENELYSIFAFSIFRNLYVESYNKMWDGNAAELIDEEGKLQFDFKDKKREIEEDAFKDKKREIEEVAFKDKYREIGEILRKYLTARCFYYVGLDEEQIAKMIIYDNLFELGSKNVITKRVGIAKKEDNCVIGRIKEQMISYYQDTVHNKSEKLERLKIVLEHFASIHYNDVSWVYGCIFENSIENWRIELLKDLLRVCGELKKPFYDGETDDNKVCMIIRLKRITIDDIQLMGLCYTLKKMDTREVVTVSDGSQVLLNDGDEVIRNIKSKIDKA